VPVAAAIRPLGRVARITEGRGERIADAWIGAAMEAIETAAGEQAPRRVRSGTGIVTGHRYPVPFGAVGLREAGSTGLAAGFDRKDATRRALFECIERDALERWLSGPHRRRMESRFEPAPAWRAVARLRGVCAREEIRPIFWRIDTDLDVPAVLCQLFDHGRDRGEIWGYTAGSAGASRWRDAAAGALLEAIQARIALRLHEPAYLDCGSRPFRLRRFALEWARAISATPQPPPRDASRPLDDPVALARKILRRRGVEPVLVPLTPASAFPAVVRVLVPGFLAPRRFPPAPAHGAAGPRRPPRAA
jgi:ribosomal protein S12 methylthiotransferase accessory factor YcaO